MSLVREMKNKTVFVTGSSKRVGHAIAMAFAHRGANLVIHHSSPHSLLDAEKAAAEARSLGVECFIVSGDQSNPEDIHNIFEQIAARFGTLDVMVNSAAMFDHTPFMEVTTERLHTVMGVNLNGPFMLTQAAARLMIDSDNKGAIINISDNSGLNGWKDRPAHSISKAGVIMLTQVSALALAEHGIRVNCVVPGPVLVPADAGEEVLDGIAAALPIGHIGDPDCVADACLFLARNGFATGSILRVDGGEGIAYGET